MVDSGALFTQGFFRKHLVRGREDRFYLWVGRFSGFAVTMVGVLYALFLIDRVLYSFLLTETLATFMGVSILGGILWRRANRWGAAASMMAALITNFTLYYLRGQRLDHWDANVFLAALSAGVAALVIVSYLTPPEPQQKTDSFFGRLQTPSIGEGSGEGVTGDLPEPTKEFIRQTAQEGQQSILVNLLHIRKGAAGLSLWRAYNTDLRGLLIGVLLAAGLVAITWLFLKM